LTRRLRLLILSYFCPPAGGPGVQRLEMLLRHLPPDVDTTILTATPEDYQAFSPLRMPLDYSRSPSGRETIRFPARLPAGLFRFLSRCRFYGAVRWFWVPDVVRRWSAAVVPHAAELHRERRFDVLFSTAPPFSVALAGRDAARSLRLPWVCDLQDLWSDYLLGAWPTRFHYRYEQQLEASALRQATSVVMITPGSRERMLRRYPFLDPNRVECITNGFDGSQLPGGSVPDPDKFVVVHTGVFCGPGAAAGRVQRLAQGRSFQPRRVERSTHSPGALIGAMELLKDARIQFHHIGPMDSVNQRLFDRSPVRDQIQVLGYRDHKAVLDELRRADAAYLCLATALDEPRNELVPQKTYEYLGSCKPVVAPIQDGDAKDFLVRAQTGFCCSPQDVPALAAVLRDLVQKKFEQRAPLTADVEYIRQFEWRSLAGKILQVLEHTARFHHAVSPMA
jgi:glycosyltransferase involved in cell wall biosynthesis